MRSNSIFQYVNMKFDISKCELIRKPSSSKNWLCFCIFFVVDTKITFGYNFGARLRTKVSIYFISKKIVA